MTAQYYQRLKSLDQFVFMECTPTTPKLWDLLHTSFFLKTMMFCNLYLLIIIVMKKKSSAHQRWFVVILFRIRFGYMWQKLLNNGGLNKREAYFSLMQKPGGRHPWADTQILRARDLGPLYFIAIQDPRLLYGPIWLLEHQQLHLNSSLQKEKMGEGHVSSF